MTTNVSNAVKAKIIGDYIKTPSGRAKLAASMTQPLRLRRDYSSVGRKTFLVEELPNGVLPGPSAASTNVWKSTVMLRIAIRVYSSASVRSENVVRTVRSRIVSRHQSL